MPKTPDRGCFSRPAEPGRSWFDRMVLIRNYDRKEPVRFDSFRFRTCRTFVGSVRFGLEIVFSGSARFGLRFSDASWLGLVRFCVRFRPVPELDGSVRPVRFGFLFLPDLGRLRCGYPLFQCAPIRYSCEIIVNNSRENLVQFWWHPANSGEIPMRFRRNSGRVSQPTWSPRKK